MSERNRSISAGWKQQLGARSDQQDACGLSPSDAFDTRGCMAVLADGIGGMEHGAEFSQVAVNAMLESFLASPEQEGVVDVLLAAYLYARDKALAMHKAGLEGGSTVAAVLVRDGYCSFLSVGDSRIYLLRGGKLLQLNREQSLGIMLDECAALGLISGEEARNNNRRAALYNNIAQDPPRPIDRNLNPLQLIAGDRLLLMSDGVYRSVDDERLRALAGGSLEQALDDVLRAVAERNDPRQDNNSIIILSCALTQREGEAVE